MHNTTKNFLFTTWEGGGNIAPVITVARKLVERGHRVRLMSDRVNQEEAAAAGIGFHAWQTAPSRTDRSPESCVMRDWEGASPEESIGRLLDKIMFGPALEYARDLTAVLDAEPADVVVTSEMLMGVLAACESRGQRAVILAANLCLYPLPDMPAFGPGLPPPRTAEEKALHEQIRLGTTALLNSRLDGLNRARTALGLMPVNSVMEQLKAADRYLLATSRAFDYPNNGLPAFIRYVGPQLDEPSWAKPWNSPWPEDDVRPLIAVGFSSTYQAHEQILQKIVDATATLPVRTVVTLGQVPAGTVHPAANTVIVQNTSHDMVMRQAAVVVTHGGHGTVMRALKHGRAMLVIPHGRDQDENAARVTAHGAGLRLTANVSVEEIRSAIGRLLNETSFSDAAHQLGLAIANETRQENVAVELETIATCPAAICV